MYLKSIEINGFKSFANKIRLEFPHGITGIVGPNGSGKSNIGDAVRWVLGEQSAKQLRGSRMEDVIFSGTQNRKPLGYAYVAIVFDNADRKIGLDYDEVRVARRVYRSGESEYMLNGSVCRRRDIVELFYDTGIGKEGYSIIGQGQVEKILSGKIEDSRELFDEAAGIAKYKKNRSAAEKSLEQERQNLERVTDILNELEKQVGPLEKQSEKAKEYLKLRDRLKELDIHLFLYDHHSDQLELDNLKKSHQITLNDLAETRQRSETISLENDALREKMNRSGQKIRELEEQQREGTEIRDRMDRAVLELKHNMDSNRALLAHYAQTEQKTQKEQKEKEQQLQEQKKNVQIRTEALEEQRDILTSLEADHEAASRKIDRLQERIHTEQDSLYESMHTEADTKEKLSRFEAMEEQLKIRNAEYNSRLLALRTARKEQESGKERLVEEIRQTRELCQSAEEDYNHQKDLEMKLKTQVHELNDAARRYNQDYLKNRSRYETLAGVVERYDGYNPAIRRIMEQKQKQPGIIGVVADILKMDQRYETAIEIALGGALQNIVTENEQTAKNMVRFLKENRYGRATFLPLSNIRRRNSGLNPALLEEDGVVGVASSLVSVDARFRDLTDSLLGRTLVVEHVDDGLALNRKNHFSLRIVTLDGELLNPGGSITGGAYRHKGNFLGRRRELDDCRGSLEEAQILEQKALKERKAVEEKREICQQTLTETEKAFRTVSLKLHDLEKLLPEQEKKSREADQETVRLKADFADLKEQIEEIRTQKEEILAEQKDSDHTLHNQTIEHLQKQLADLQKELGLRETKKNEQSLTVAKMEQQALFDASTIDRLQSEITSCKNQMAEYRKRQKDLSDSNENLKRESDRREQELLEIRHALQKTESLLEELRQENQTYQKEQNDIFSRQKECNDRIVLLEKEESRVSGRMEKLVSSLESGAAYMWENYELTYKTAQQLSTFDMKMMNIRAMREEKKENTRSIRALGSVNINAIEEFKEVGERYQFLSGQYRDIKESEEKLLRLIEELNRAMQEQFTENFQKIRESFTHVFTDLFEGGTADLALMDESNILETGIRIIAQPPGKKLQSILLLSGGERALTAIALLFAIQNLKPSPFCLLDEIEAALDDANIVRFSKYLKKLSADTQFIVITHRRGTMLAADSLYGITMQERGISTLISVDLIDDQLK